MGNLSGIAKILGAVAIVTTTILGIKKKGKGK